MPISTLHTLLLQLSGDNWGASVRPQLSSAGPKRDTPYTNCHKKRNCQWECQMIQGANENAAFLITVESQSVKNTHSLCECRKKIESIKSGNTPRPPIAARDRYKLRLHRNSDHSKLFLGVRPSAARQLAYKLWPTLFYVLQLYMFSEFIQCPD